MPKLTQQQLASRLKYDYIVAKSIAGSLIDVHAFRSVSDLKRRRNAISTTAKAENAKHYLIEYRIKSLKAKGVYHTSWLCHVDLLAEGNYPFSRPVAHIISQPVPWSPHFLQGVGSICLGDNFWRNSNGDILLYHLVIHVAKLLNFDEPWREYYFGWNREAVEFWGSNLGRKPITPNLKYPIPPPELTHGSGTPSPPTTTLFKPIGNVTTKTNISPDTLNQFFKKAR